jgi:hypothetical protein
MCDQKMNDLDYNPSYKFVKKSLDRSVPLMDRVVARGDLFPGVPASMVDSTGHGFVDSSQTGMNGQGYGLASYKKGLMTSSLTDVNRASQSSISIKEHKPYE